MDNLLRFFRHYGLSICVALTILYVCLMPSEQAHLDTGIPNFDKFVHFCMFFALSFCIGLNLYQEYTPYKSIIMIILAMVIPALYGGLIELLQENLTATRTCDLFDFIADSLGAISSYFFGSWFVPRHFKQNEN